LPRGCPEWSLVQARYRAPCSDTRLPRCGTLEEAQRLKIQTIIDKADIAPRDHELEIGCGWGSLTLYLAERFPGTEIVAVSNSATQKAHIDKCCAKRGFTNVEVVTADINDFAPAGRFDRVLSIEMFEHHRAADHVATQAGGGIPVGAPVLAVYREPAVGPGAAYARGDSFGQGRL